MTFRGPLIHRIPAPVKAQGEPFPAPSPLYTPNPAQPFTQNIWDNPARAFPQIVGEVVGTLAPLLTPNPAQPFAQFDWPRALGPRPKAVGEATGPLSPVDTPNPPQPFTLSDWPRPSDPRKAIGEAVGTLNPLLTPNPAQPFAQADWPRPNDPRAKAIGEALGTLNALLTPNPAQPFNQNLWDNAVRAFPRIVGEPVGTLNPLLTPPVVVQYIIAQFDWPNPARPSPLDRSFTSSGNALTTVFAPFYQLDWLAPTRGLPSQASDAAANLFPLTHPNPAQPFAQSDWANAKSLPLMSDRGVVFGGNAIFTPPPPAGNLLIVHTPSFARMNN